MNAHTRKSVPEGVRRGKPLDETFLNAWVGKRPSELRKLVPFDPTRNTHDGKKAAANDED